MAELELHDEVVEWMDSLDDAERDRTVVDRPTRRPGVLGTDASVSTPIVGVSMATAGGLVLDDEHGDDR